MRIPRPEYPRPDLRRGREEGRDWLNLNGPWLFAFDPGDEGLGAEWQHRPNEAFPTTLLVPFPWESPAAWGQDRERRDWNEEFLVREAYLDPGGVGMDNYRTAERHTIGWYRRTVTIPESWRGRPVFLNFGAVDHHATVFVNGIRLGEHEGGYTPFGFDITGALGETGPAVITVRAQDPQDHRDQPAGKQIHWYQRTSGIWQTVYLEPRGLCYVEQVHARPDVDAEAVEFRIWLGGDEIPGATVEVTVVDPDEAEAGRVSAAASVGEVLRVGLGLPDVTLWDIDAPALYRAQVCVMADGVVVDSVEVSFGMRKVFTAPLPGTDCRYVWLNDRPVYLRGALDQSFNPWGVYAFRTEDEMIADLQAAIDAGFNWLRIHIKAEDPVFLHHADRMGVLLMCDMPNFDSAAYGPLAQGRWEAMARDLIARDYNHPSIFSWCLFNETWGLGGEAYKQMPERHDWVRRMVALARALDDTRLVEDNSPCLYDHVETDLNSWHFYINDYGEAREHIANVVAHTYPGSGFNYVPGAVQGDEPLLNSEYGGISAGMGDRDVSWCFRFLTNELRRHERICGYVYTELQDIEWERNGFLNYDRTPKSFGYDPTDINADDVLVLDAPPGQVVLPGAEIRVPAVASLFSPDRWAAARLSWQVDFTDTLGRTRIAATEGAMDVSAPPWRVTGLGEMAVRLPAEPGLALVRAVLEDAEGHLLGRACLAFDIEGSAPPAGAVVVPFRPDGAAMDGLDGSVSGSSSAELVAGAGRGAITLSACVPEGIPPAGLRRITFVAEMASYRPTDEQTDERTFPSDVEVRLGSVLIGKLTLPDCPADANGVLSYIHGIPGRYGYRVELKVYGPRLREVLRELRLGEAKVRVRIVGDDRDANGIAVLFRGAGRFPMDPALIFETED